MAALSGCAARAAGGEPPAEGVSTVPVAVAGRSVPRRPDAVVVDPPSALPDPVERASARGVVALRQPLGDEAVREVVKAVLEAWQSESVDQLVALLTEDAGPIEARARGRAVLVDAWRQRMHAHEYHRLAGVEVARPDRVERYFWDDLSAPDAPARPPDMRKDELFVRAPLDVTHFAGERLFGDWLLLLLRREEGKYKIAAYGEVDAP